MAIDLLERPTFLEISWRDPVTGRPGYVVIDRLVRGVASGGLRARVGLTLPEVRGLAKGMTLKEGLHYAPADRYIPLGGAKGGIDCDPRSPEMPGMLERFARAVSPLLRDYWATGEDLGVSQTMIDEAFARAGLRSSIVCVDRVLDDREAGLGRLAAAFSIDVDGVGLDELVGGCGVAQAAAASLRRLDRPVEGARVFVQGYGSMGGATARFLAAMGARVVGVSDVDGVVANPAGLDVERLLLTRTEIGGLDRAQLGERDEQLPRDAWLDVDCDVLVPAAGSYVIGPDEASRVRAAVVVEAANMPVLPEAEQQLRGRGVTVVPDFVANSMTNAWWWWTLFGDIEPTAQSSFTKIERAMTGLVGRLFDRCETSGRSLREEALAVTQDNWELIARTYPTDAVGE